MANRATLVPWLTDKSTTFKNLVEEAVAELTVTRNTLLTRSLLSLFQGGDLSLHLNEFTLSQAAVRGLNLSRAHLAVPGIQGARTQILLLALHPWR